MSSLVYFSDRWVRASWAIRRQSSQNHRQSDDWLGLSTMKSMCSISKYWSFVWTNLLPLAHVVINNMETEPKQIIRYSESSLPCMHGGPKFLSLMNDQSSISLSSSSVANAESWPGSAVVAWDEGVGTRPNLKWRLESPKSPYSNTLNRTDPTFPPGWMHKGRIMSAQNPPEIE